MSSSPRRDAELQRLTRQQEAVAELGQRALETDGLDEVLHDAATVVVEALDADYCEVLELDPVDGRFDVAADAGEPGERVESATRSAESDSPAGLALDSETPVLVDDLSADDRFDGADRLVEGGVENGIAVSVGPLAPPWGVIGVYATEPDAFADGDATFLRTVATVVASAVESEETKSRLDEVYGRISDGFFALDEEWRFTYLNDHAEDLIGSEGRSLVGETVWDAFPEAVGRAFETAYERAMYDQETVSFEEYYPDPIDAWFEVSAYPSESGLSVYFREVTERKEREQRLAEQERQLSTLMANVPGMVYRCRNERGWPMEFVSEGCHDLTGHDPAAFERGDLSFGADVVVDADRERLWTEVQRGLDADGTFLVTYRIETADGERRWVQERGRGRYEDGDLVGLEGVVIDVTERKRAERRLAEERDMFTEGPAVVFRWENEPGWPVEYVSENVADVFGYDPEALQSGDVPYTDLLLDEEIDRIAAEVEEHSDETTQRFSHEPYRVKTSDGDVRWVEDTTKVVRDESGEITHFLGYLVDVTERKERERELRRYETIVETIDDGIYVKDDDGRFTMVNEAYAEMLGYEPEELVGEHASLVVDEAVVEKARRAESAARDGPGDSPALEAQLETADGDRLPAEATFATLETEEGVEQRVGVVRDISERRERERKLEESERRYRTLAEHFPNGAVGVYDRDLRYTLAAGAKTDDVLPAADRMEGESMPDLFPDDTVADLEPLFRAAVADGETDSTTTEFGGRHWRVWATPLRDAEGEIFAGLSFAQDITERREYERMLEESNERLEQFAYAASHDLQEPLRMVSSYLQLIESRYGDELDDDGREFLEFAVDGADRMRDMIDGLLEYSRVETRGDPFEPVALDDVLVEVRDDLSVKIDESDAALSTEPLPRVEGDRGQLRQVFQNLIDNAIEYSGDERPRIRLSTERRDDEHVVSVHDEGIGLDPDEADRAFQVFQRLHDGEEHAGSGIGLALCERIVERHGGDIWVESEPGEGATFSFTLPAPVDDDE
ncbi:PAS domain S-box protein [Halosimplex salinum]|uniref:PAS domain S-box protein n=1 Tax=Halosimplex salinum TaxID=1710538 RepID=UPI000F47C53C|nr:PAS domain S-box protein [Halosimplex salinum]